jgi:MFS family permease
LLDEDRNRMEGVIYYFYHFARLSYLCQVGALYFSYLFCQTMVSVHIYVHAKGLNVPSASAASIISVYGIFQIIGMNIIGYTADRFTNKMGFRIAFSLMVVSFVWLLLVARDATTFYIFGAMMGFSARSMQILFSPMVAEIFGLKSHGVILGATSFMASWGAASGSLVAGYIFDVNHSYAPAFMISSILALLAVVNVSLVRPLEGKVRKANLV